MVLFLVFFVIYVLIRDFMKDRARTVIIRKKGYQGQITAKRSRVQTGRAFRICDLVGVCLRTHQCFLGRVQYSHQDL